MQRGPYDPNGYAAAATPRSTAPTTTFEGGRYAGGQTYGGSTVAVSTSPPSAVSPLGAGSSLPVEGVAAAGYQQPSTTSSPTGTDYPATYPSTAPEVAVSPRNYAGQIGNAPAYAGGGSGRYGVTGSDGTDAATAPETALAAAPTYGSPSAADAASQASPSVTPQPYRPGGTSDYMGPGSSPISIAERQPGDAAPAGQANTSAAEPSAPTGRYGMPASGNTGSQPGRRY